MIGKDHLRLNQRKQQGRDHDHRYRLEEFALKAGQVQQREERDGGRQYSKGHGHTNQLCPTDRRRHPLIGILRLFFLILTEYGLTDDDGVIDHNAQHQDETKQGNQVDRGVQPRHHGKSPHEGNRNAQRHPKGQRRAQEQPQDDQYQKETNNAVGDQHI